MTNHDRTPFVIRHSDIDSSFVIRASSFRASRDRAFTLIELLIVISIIIVLAGLILATSGYVHKKGQRSRAEAEIAALSAALESYKADNGIYPTDAATNALNPSQHFNPDQRSDTSANQEYFAAGASLYTALSGNDANSQQPVAGAKSYFSFKAQMLDRKFSGGTTFVRDPFSSAYGYSTLKATTPASPDGFNPTYDLWSTAGETTAAGQIQWIKNW